MKGFFSEVLVIVMSIVAAIVFLTAVGPIVQEGKKLQTVNDARQILKNVDSVINQLAVEAAGAKRTVNIDLPDGIFILSGKDDSIKIRIENTNLLKTGTSVTQENIVYRGGGGVDAYESSSNGQTNLILENDAVLFAVKKIGTSSSPAFINTTSFIANITNKIQKTSITPRTGIFIDDDELSSYGTGYTELPSIQNSQSGAIILHMNSTANITYDAVFTLSSASDYIDLQVKNMVKR